MTDPSGIVIEEIQHATIPWLSVELRVHDANFATDQNQSYLFEHGFFEAVLKRDSEPWWSIMIAQYATNASPLVSNNLCSCIMLYPFESLEGIGVDYAFNRLQFWGICRDLRSGQTYPKMIPVPEEKLDA